MCFYQPLLSSGTLYLCDFEVWYSCSICKPVCLPSHVFSLLRHLPHPVPAEDGHYLPFAKVFEMDTTGEFVLLYRKQDQNLKVCLSMPVYLQHVKNCQLMVQCENCNMWQLIFSKYKLKTTQRQHLQQLLGNLSYT